MYPDDESMEAISSVLWGGSSALRDAQLGAAQYASMLRLNVVARRDANQAGQRQQRHGHCSPPRQQQHHHGQQAQPQRDDEDRQE